MKKILAEISAGELIDKITILEIKKENIPDKEKLSNIEKELSALKLTMNQNIEMSKELTKLKSELKKLIPFYGILKIKKENVKVKKNLIVILLIYLDKFINQMI